MNEELKKKLARDWFKILQDMICLEIELSVLYTVPRFLNVSCIIAPVREIH